jgi:hypothetical protein
MRVRETSFSVEEDEQSYVEGQIRKQDTDKRNIEILCHI